MKFQKTTIDFLKSMGWSEDRRVDACIFITSLIDDGYEPFPMAVSFLENFGGLDGSMPAYRVKGELERIHFNPKEAIDEIYREKVVTYEARIGERLVVVGSANNGHLTLVLSPQGRMFGANDDYLCLLGNSVEEGITALFENVDAEEVPQGQMGQID
ncbi:SUKH-3 domain-containing protein [Pseudoduganella violaceinigra]|uniref:SUKH-3 domain-containing protein n=1 Tax=Pseudoduganella violaceinigra TaxID=246602 RepID=UPI000A053CBF|nr:SUKH-3 domain-containing protein [Pseudoduganella violaceinigra]